MPLTTYTKTAWANGTSPAINSTNLGKIEDRLYDLTEEALTPTIATTTTVTAEVASLPSTTLKSRMDVIVEGNTRTPYDDYTKLLMYFEGADGSTTFTDQTGKTVTGSGNAQIDTAQYRVGSASLLLDGTGDYLTVTDASSELDIGTQSFTFECWIRLNAVGATRYIADFRQATATDVAPMLYIHSTNKIRYASANVTVITGTTALTTGQWYHVAVSKSGTSTRLFLNGVQEGSTYTDNNNYIAITSFKLGSIYDGLSAWHNGWIDDLRVSVGIARYTSNFIPLPMRNLFSDKLLVRVTGKNLYNGFAVGSTTKEVKIISKSSFSVKFISGTLGTHNLFPSIKFKENTRYTFSGIQFEDDDTKNTRLFIIYTDGSNDSFASPTTIPTSFSIVSDASKTIKMIDVSYGTATLGTVTYQNFMIEEGTTATTYQEYTETTAYIDASIKKISSTVKDIFEVDTGTFTQHITSDLDISGTQYASIDTATYVNVDVVKTTAFADMIPTTTGIDGIALVFDKNGKLLTEVAQADIDNLTSVGKYYIHTDKSIWFIVANGAYADIASARTGLGTTQAYYKLATPVIKNYYPNIINAEPNGTIYCYPAIRDYDFYDNGCGVSNTAYPINYLEYVNIVDKATGTFTPVDLATCTVATGGQSFTSTAIATNDLVDFGYTHKDLSTVADVIYSYATDMKATVDGNTNSIRDLDEKQEQSNIALNLKTDEILRDLKILRLMGGL